MWTVLTEQNSVVLDEILQEFPSKIEKIIFTFLKSMLLAHNQLNSSVILKIKLNEKPDYQFANIHVTTKIGKFYCHHWTSFSEALDRRASFGSRRQFTIFSTVHNYCKEKIWKLRWRQLHGFSKLFSTMVGVRQRWTKSKQERNEYFGSGTRVTESLPMDFTFLW